jgi:hypothetical protein
MLTPPFSVKVGSSVFGRVAAMVPLLLAAPLLAGAEAELAPISEPVEGPTRWSSFLPFMADEALKRGYELPLPFGASAIYDYIQRDIKVNDLRIGLNGAPLQSVL